MTQAIRDENHVTVALGVSDADASVPLPFTIDAATGRLMVEGFGGGGSVVSVAVATANGFAGTVATATTTPVITLSTSVTGLLKGNGTAISAAVSNTDYQAVINLTTIGTSGAATFDGTTLNIPSYSGGGGGGVTSVSGTTNRITSSGGATPVIDISATFEALLGKVASPLSQFAATTSAQLLGMMSDGTGTGLLVFGTSPTLITPTLGVATATSINKVAITAPATSATLTIANGKTLTFNNSITFAGTDSTVMTFPSTSATLARTDAANTFTGIQTMTSPALLTSVTTSSVSFTAFAGATTLLTIGGTGASASLFAPSTLDATSSITGAIRTSGGISAAKALNIGTTGTFGGAITSGGVAVPTISSVSLFTNKTLGGVTEVANAGSLNYIVPTVDTTFSGETTNSFNCGYTSSAIGDLVILDSSGTWQKTDANTSSIYNGLLGIALEVKASGVALKVLLKGFIYGATAFPTFTVGGTVYMSETAGAVTQTAPVTTDSATRIVGYAVHADKMYFNPSPDWITHV